MKIEIKQFNWLPEDTEVRGKWYISRTEDNLDFEYLHPDGVWRKSMMNSDKDSTHSYSGYHDTQEQAELTLKNWKDKNETLPSNSSTQGW